MVKLKNNYKKIDNCGLSCPQPVINTKKALDEMPAGVVDSVVDNQVAKENITRFAQNANLEVKTAEGDGKFTLTIKKGDDFSLETALQVMVTEPVGQDIYLIATDALGQGPPELGYVLMNSFMTTIKELKTVPAVIIFMNTGVRLACTGSKTLGDLIALQQESTEILACGACLEYFNLKSDLAVGKISNMYEIVGKMQQGKVITIG